MSAGRRGLAPGNWEALRAGHPALMERLGPARRELAADADAGLAVPGPDGTRTLAFGDLEKARRWVWAQPLASVGCGTVIALGAGDGAHLPALVERLPERCELVVLEPDPELFLAVLARVELAPLLSRPHTRLCIGPPDETISEMIAGLDALRLEVYPVLFLPHPDLPWLAPGLREAVEREILLFVRGVALARQMDQLQSPYIVPHTLENTLAFAAAPGVDALGGLLEGQTVALVAEGPTLAASLPLLTRYQHRAVVVATETALASCLLAGLEPDLVLVGDPMPANDHYFHYGEAPPRVKFVLEPRVTPLTWKRAAGRVFTGVMNDNAPDRRPTRAPGAWLENGLGPRGALWGPGSLTLCGLGLARSMGASSVVLVEPDLACPRAVHGFRREVRVGDEAPAGEAYAARTRRLLSAQLSELPFPVYHVAPGEPLPGAEDVSLAEALARSFADHARLHAELGAILARTAPSDPQPLVDEIEDELGCGGDFPTAPFRGFVPLLARAALNEAERLRLAAELAPGRGRRREMLARAALREEEGSAAALRRLRALLSRTRRRIAEYARREEIA